MWESTRTPTTQTPTTHRPHTDTSDTQEPRRHSHPHPRTWHVEFFEYCLFVISCPWDTICLICDFSEKEKHFYFALNQRNWITFFCASTMRKHEIWNWMRPKKFYSLKNGCLFLLKKKQRDSDHIKNKPHTNHIKFKIFYFLKISKYILTTVSK